MMKRDIKCRWCGSINHIKKGYRKTLNRGKIQKYLCLDCKKYFTFDNGFYRMRNSSKIITMSIDMYLSNLSSRKMRNMLKRHFGLNVDHTTVLEWVRKYTLKVNKYVEGLGYNLGDNFYADETKIRRKGKIDNFWACVDWNTRLITGFHYSLICNTQEAVTFLKKSISKGKPKYIQTDSARFYQKAFRKLFYTTKMGQNGGLTVQHKIQNYQKTRIHNYKIETVFMKLKDRVHDFRGLKALWSAPILLQGLILQHNFIEKHSTTGRIPCELAGQHITQNPNRWLELIRLAS